MPANIAFAASKNYPHPDVVRRTLAALPVDTQVLVAGRGAGATMLVRLAREVGRTVRRIAVNSATGWRGGNRALVADGDGVIAFAAGIDQRLWDLMGLARCAGHDRVFFGPAGESWNPPMSPGDVRERPFFVADTCEICGDKLVLVDLLDSPDATDIWYDEWTCSRPECQEYGEVTDAPAWYFRGIFGVVAKARKHAARGGDDDDEFLDSRALRKRLKRTEALEAAVTEAEASGDKARIRAALVALTEDQLSDWRLHERLATLAEEEGDAPGALAAAKDALAYLLWGEHFNGADFTRVRSTLRRCRAALA